jgi:acetolactate synthase-1/2/3 large subunit
VEVLERFGVRYALTVPGESFLRLLDALCDSSIRLVATRHERGVALMSEAVGTQTGMSTLCVETWAVGAANLVIGLATAREDSIPPIAVVAQVEAPFRYRRAFEEVELAWFLAPGTTWSVEVPDGARIPELVAEEFRRAVHGRPASVALTDLVVLFNQEIPEAEHVSPAPPSSAPRTELIPAMLVALRGAVRPLVAASGDVLQSEATEDVVQLGERFSVPLITTSGHHFRVLGTVLIPVDVSTKVVGQACPAGLAIAADVPETIRALFAVAGDCPDRSSANHGDRSAFDQATPVPSATELGLGVDPAAVIAALQRWLLPDAQVTSDAANFSGWLLRLPLPTAANLARAALGGGGVCRGSRHRCRAGVEERCASRRPDRRRRRPDGWQRAGSRCTARADAQLHRVRQGCGRHDPPQCRLA